MIGSVLASSIACNGDECKARYVAARFWKTAQDRAQQQHQAAVVVVVVCRHMDRSKPPRRVISKQCLLGEYQQFGT